MVDVEKGASWWEVEDDRRAEVGVGRGASQAPEGKGLSRTMQVQRR